MNGTRSWLSAAAHDPEGSAACKSSSVLSSSRTVETSSPRSVKLLKNALAVRASQSARPARVRARSTRPSASKTLPSQSRNDPASASEFVRAGIVPAEAQHALDPSPVDLSEDDESCDSPGERLQNQASRAGI